MRTDEDQLLLMGTPVAETFFLRWFREHLEAPVTVRAVSQNYAGMSLSGPKSREVLAKLTNADVSPAGLPFLRVRQLTIGLARALVARLSFTGELGYEIYMNPASAVHVYEALHAAGREFGLRDFGVRALTSLRIEKGYGSWGREYSQDFTPEEARLTRLLKLDKGDFIGREAALTARTSKPTRLLSCIRIESKNIDPAGGEAVLYDGRAIGRLTSGAHAYTYDCGLGLAYIPTDVPRAAPLEVEILGHRYPAVQLEEAPYDPRGQRLRA